MSFGELNGAQQATTGHSACQRVTTLLTDSYEAVTLGTIRGDGGGKVLVQWLREKQRAEGVTDEMFAGRMGMLRSHWTQIRLGIRQANSLRVLRGALLAYPEHREEIIRMIETTPAEVE